jgi:hypothetical protein
VSSEARVVLGLVRALFQVLALGRELEQDRRAVGAVLALGPGLFPERLQEPERLLVCIAAPERLREREPDAQPVQERVPEQRCELQRVQADEPARWRAGPRPPPLRPGEAPASLSRDEQR